MTDEQKTNLKEFAGDCAFIFQASLTAMREYGEDEEIVVTFATIMLRGAISGNDGGADLAEAMFHMTPGGSA